MGSGVSYTNEERDGEEVLSGVQEAATDSPSSLHPSVSKRRQQIKCRRVSSVGCRSTQDTSSEGESFSMGAARRRVPPPHRQEMPWHGACSYRPALPMGAKRTPRKLKDHRKDHEKNIKGNTRPIFLLPRIWGSMATYRCISNTGKKGWGDTDSFQPLHSVSQGTPCSSRGRDSRSPGKGLFVGTHDPNYKSHTFSYIKRTVCRESSGLGQLRARGTHCSSVLLLFLNFTTMTVMLSGQPL